VRAFAEDRIARVASPMLLAELGRVLRRPKFSRYVGERTTLEFVERIHHHAEIVDDPAERPTATRDRDDDSSRSR
jgi:predicted nucleic acid-binding protein